MIPYILTEKSLTVVIEGKAHTMNNDHPSFERAKEALQNEEWDRMENLFDVSKAVEDYLDADAGIEVKDGAVFYQGEAIHNLVTDKVLDFMRKNLPYQPLVKFLANMMDNPSRRAIDELYSFLEHKNMPITPEGNFLAYKGVTDDFKDFHTRTFSNKVGDVLEMRRNGVCDDASLGCASGFHAGSYEYAKGYASNGGNLMIVEINPADVVSVPYDCSCQKLRTSKYKVVGHYETIDAPPLDEGLNTDFYDYDEELSDYDEGYEQAKRDYGIEE